MARRYLTLLITFLCLLAGPSAAQDQVALSKEFQQWLVKTVWPLARREGVSKPQFETALNGVSIVWDLPGVNFPNQKKKTQKQSEFASPGRYFRQSTLEGNARIGKTLAARHARTLEKITRKTGVPGHIILAIWGRESGFGNVGANYNAYRVLATRGFFGPNQDYFTGELVAALKIGKGQPVKSSWAGALGQPQMMPTSFLAYGADGNGDGQVDIWESEADTLASIAKFLADHDWVAGRDWGFEVTLPPTLSCTLEGIESGRKISDWEKLGVRRVNSRPFPKVERNQVGYLLMPAGIHGPAFIVTPNFYVLKRYNRSDLYALFIGNSADRIAFGMKGFRANWPKSTGLLRSDVAAIQGALESSGYDTGGVDGLAGTKTRRSIGEWQEAKGLASTCFPSTQVLRGL